jgi:hypothetical protein
MKINVRILLLFTLSWLVPGLISGHAGDGTKDSDIRNLWRDCKLDKILPFNIFGTGITGYMNTDSIRKKEIITIIDFSKPSTAKRCFVIDIKNRKLLYHCFVAHGKNSGDNFASSFSNQPESLKSSLGFYLTAETYSGKHGYSLRLDGLERNINDKARTREIVIHGAEYVSQEYIDKYGRLGRSWGCPALPPGISKAIIDIISHGSCLFIYGNDESYFVNSSFARSHK